MNDATRVPRPASSNDLRLSDFIRDHSAEIIAEWVTFARTKTPASETMTHLALKDHIAEILEFIADDLDTPQSSKEQVAKSHGLEPPNSPMSESAAEIHATLRLADGFNIDQMVSEYRALRASVVKQWIARNQALASTDLDDLTRFNEAIDQALAESVAQYTKMITHSRDLFLGVLGHDLRNPIGAASMAAQLMLRTGAPEARETALASQIVNATERAINIVNDLLDVTRTAFGTEISLVRTPFDMRQLAGRLVEELRSLSSNRTITLQASGDTEGTWDRSRVGQVLSNLIGNALQYSNAGSEITVVVAPHEDQVLLSVHNMGPPIPPEKIKVIFDSLTRGRGSDKDGEGSTNLGLGLFIAEKIVNAHGGEISVTSSAETGTIFTVLLPKG